MYPCGRKKYFSSSSGLLLDEDATGIFGRKPDNNVFITKFLILGVRSLAVARRSRHSETE